MLFKRSSSWSSRQLENFLPKHSATKWQRTNEKAGIQLSPQSAGLTCRNLDFNFPSSVAPEPQHLGAGTNIVSSCMRSAGLTFHPTEAETPLSTLGVENPYRGNWTVIFLTYPVFLCPESHIYHGWTFTCSFPHTHLALLSWVTWRSISHIMAPLLEELQRLFPMTRDTLTQSQRSHRPWYHRHRCFNPLRIQLP